jgi:ribonucleoside-diphosphate reductase alpha chain
MTDNRPILTENGRRLVESRYLLRDDNRKIIETPRQMMERVAKCLVAAEYIQENRDHFYHLFLENLLDLAIVPASPYFFNARDPEKEKVGGLFSCFVIPIGDSIDEIYECMAQAAKIYQRAGGVGIDFSPLRENGAIVVTSKGIATGPLSFMKVFNFSSEAVVQGGRRRGASLAALDISHPDIESFIIAKSTNLPEINRLLKIINNSTDQVARNFAQIELKRLQEFTQFNLSVKVTDEFMKAVKENADWSLISPHNKQTVKIVKARKLFQMICDGAWRSGCPGMIYIDNVNKANKLPGLGRINVCNPCGEIYGHNYHACNLIAINLNKCLIHGPHGHRKKQINFNKIKELAEIAVRMSDNAIDVSDYPLEIIKENVQATRGVGVGLMGFADILIALEIPYDSEAAQELLRKICRTLSDGCFEASTKLAEERGNFANYEKSIWTKKKIPMRNAWLTSLQPTGSISIIAGASQSIEPLFNVFYRRKTHDGQTYIELHERFKEVIQKEGLVLEDILAKLVKTGSIQVLDIPDYIKSVFRCAQDISPKYHVAMQAAAQEFIDQGIAKTVNAPNQITSEQIVEIYILAHEMGLKGITVFREGSKPGVLETVDSADIYDEKLKKFLIQKFIREDWKAKEIAEFLGVTEQAVFSKLKKYGIKKKESATLEYERDKPIGNILKEVILANFIGSPSRVQIADHQASYRQVSDHLNYVRNIRKLFTDRGISCSNIESVLTDRIWYYFDTTFMRAIYDLPFEIGEDNKPIVNIEKRDINTLITPHFMRHLFLISGVVTGHGGISFDINSQNGKLMRQILIRLNNILEINIKIHDDSIYIPKSMTNIFYNFIEGGEDIEVTYENALCPECGNKLIVSEHCRSCNACGWSACSV